MVDGSQGSGLPPSGVSVALVTPVDTAGRVDLDSVDRLVARAVAGGVAGLAPTGSTGEGWRLDPGQRREVLARVVAGAGGRPVIAGIPLRTPEEFVAELAPVADAGADAVLVAPPAPYALSDDEIVELFTDLADRSPLPLVLYHIPALAGVGFGPEAVARLAPHPHIAGLKDSARDLEYLHTVVRKTRGEQFRVVTGADTLLAESVALGAVGTIAASPNVVPALAPALFDAIRAGDQAGIARVRDRLTDLVATARGAGFPAGWKAAASLTDACGPRPVPPGHPVSSERLAELARRLTELRILGPDTAREATSGR